ETTTADNQDDAYVMIVGATICNVRIQKDATGIYLSGDTVTWTITYGNDGNGICNNIVITDLGGTGNTIASGTVLRTGSSLTPGQTGSFTITGTVYGNSGDQATNNVIITTTSIETTTADNQDDAYVMIVGAVIPPSPLFNIAISKSVTPSITTLGGVVVRTLTYSNPSLATGYDVMIQDPLAPELSFNSASHGGVLSGSTVMWSLGILAPGATGIVTMTTTVHSGFNGQIIPNTAYIYASGGSISGGVVIGNGSVFDETTYIDNAASASVTISIPSNGGNTYVYIPLPAEVKQAVAAAQPILIETIMPKKKIIDKLRDIIIETKEDIMEQFILPVGLPNTGAER
ncbi:MAG TPA: hypothetical protein PLW93_04355, partial [Candidatus Absconditabacterales bacterium]|nr:hypothetical protein [Candidatus Absconditabacterales bacterium]HNG97474.1 hypothetical protein [Candidatus Absconditabacterales bacterium]